MKNLKPPSWFWGLLILWILSLAVPVVWMGFKSVGLPGEFSLIWYERLFSNEAWQEALLQSLQVATMSSFLATGLALPVVISDSQVSKKIFYFFSLLGFALPEIVFALSLLSWFVQIALPLGSWALVVAHVTFSLALALFLIGNRWDQMPQTALEAARDLGANDKQVFFKIILPFLAPSLIASLLLCFLQSFDDFLISFFLTAAGQDTLPVKLFSGMKMGLSSELDALGFLMVIFSGVVLVVLSPILWKDRRQDLQN